MTEMYKQNLREGLSSTNFLDEPSLTFALFIKVIT